jgi:hypothetical protein
MRRMFSKVWNPLAQTEWTGDWSDDPKHKEKRLWTPKMRELIGYEKKVSQIYFYCLRCFCRMMDLFG